jgi:rare lipoprotein A
MKWFLMTLALAAALTAGAMPASADVYDNWLSDLGRHESQNRSGQLAQRRGYYGEERSARSERRRIARANISDEADFGYRPRHTARGGDRAQNASATRKSRQQRQLRRVASNRPAPHARAPRWAQRTLSTTESAGSGQSGMASYYWQGQRVASGGWFNPNAMTAAHKSLPFGTRVRVTHSHSGRSVDVVINDRGPFVAGRIIDLSRAAASAIGMTGQGIARVKVMVLGR